MNLGKLTLSKKLPTKPGWYFWQNDILYPNGKFVNVFDFGGSLGYLFDNEWVGIQTFTHSRWSEHLDFFVEFVGQD